MNMKMKLVCVVVLSIIITIGQAHSRKLQNEKNHMMRKMLSHKDNNHNTTDIKKVGQRGERVSRLSKKTSDAVYTMPGMMKKKNKTREPELAKETEIDSKLGDGDGDGCGLPLPIFILAGQSNMVGMGSVKHLEILLNSTDTHDEYAPLWNTTTNDWVYRTDVYAKFDDHVGPLTVNFGAPSRGEHLGPELGFGWVLGDAFCGCRKPILLLKTAYGGRNLAVDFRSPSSGKGNYPNAKPIKYGWQYRMMIEQILKALQDESLQQIVPGYNPAIGYNIAGFVWFQGWNDMINWAMVNEYESNLANFIRDVRDDLSAPNMPFIVGELGMHGPNPMGRGRARVLEMRQAERNVTKLPEFVNNTRFVPTAQYAVLNGTTYNGAYHYNGRADTYYHIGQAMGRAMLDLMPKSFSSCNVSEPLSKTTKSTSMVQERSTVAPHFLQQTMLEEMLIQQDATML